MIMRWSGRVPSSKVAIVQALTPHRSTKESTMQRRRFSSFIPVFAGAALCTGAAWASSPGPQPVSPFGEIADRCPTFSWSVADAGGYELVVYGVTPEDEVGPRPIVSTRLPRGAQSWTPPIGSCLDPGGSYAWSLRSVMEEGAGDWSEPALFEVRAAPSVREVEAALTTLRRFLDGAEAGGDGEPAGSETAAELASRAARRDAPERETRAGRRSGIGEVSGLVPVAGPFNESSESAISTESAPAPSATPSLAVSDQIHLDRDSDFFKDDELFLWDDTFTGNLALGHRALSSASGSATGNTAVGEEALEQSREGTDSSDGSANTALGFRSLWTNTTGSFNTAVGANALLDNNGSSNAALGYEALFNNLTGDQNTALGEAALFNNETGSKNVAIGWTAGFNLGIDSSTGSSFNNNVFIAHPGQGDDENTIRIGTFGTHTTAAIAGDAGIGTESPQVRLHVADAESGGASISNHVAFIENSSSDGSADVLALKIDEGAGDIGHENNFISFKDANSNIGAIQGNGSGGVELGGPGSDYAEWLPKLDPSEPLKPGDVVGLFGDRVTKTTAGAMRTMVISSGPIVIGNDPGAGRRRGYARVAFVGQAPVKVEGPVRRGDVVVASGRHDGTAVAMSPGELPSQRVGEILGRALESSDGERSKVRVLIGLADPLPFVAAMQRLQRGVAERDAEIAVLRAEVAELRKLVLASPPTLSGLAPAGATERRIEE